MTKIAVKQNKNSVDPLAHLWLSKVNSVEEYLPPTYYRDLLKEYSFADTPDIDYLQTFLKQQNAKNILELGCGSGRASDVAVQILPKSNFLLTDLSDRMIAYTKGHFLGKNNISYEAKDAVTFLSETKEKYDLVYTLWSFSHSVHQHVHRLGFEGALDYVRSTLTKFINENLVQGGKFFIMHFDSMSEEQQILMRQWKRSFPEFSDLTQQSPSKRILDSVFTEMDNHNKIILSVKHLCGDPIRYSSQEEYLEIFMNFHLETFFNESQYLAEVITDLKNQSAKYKQKDGSYIIKPGCYIYTFEKK